MGRKIKAKDEVTGKLLNVEADSIRPGRIKNPTLPESLLRRVRAVHSAIQSAYDLTLEQFEITFMREGDPEGEIALWERIVIAFEKITQAMPKLSQRMVLRTLLAYSMDFLTAAEQADPEVKRIIEIAEGE